MYLKWGMLPDFGWTLIILIPFFLISLWVARKASKRIIWLLPALVLYFFVGWEFNGFLEWVFRFVFWLTVLVVIVTAVLTASGRYERTRGSRAPLFLMGLMLGILLVSGLIGYVLRTQADELRNFGWNGWLIMALIFGIVGVILFFLKRLLGVIALTLAVVFLFMGIGGASLQDTDREFTGRPEGEIDLCLTVDGENNRRNIQKVLPEGWTYVENSGRDCLSSDPSETPTGTPTSTPTSTVTEEPEAVEPDETCPKQFVQDIDPNFRNRAVTKGFEGSPGLKRTQILDAMARDYRYLDAVGDFVFDRDYDASALYVTYEDAFCLSEAGQNLYYDVRDKLMASPVASGLAPKNGYNSGFRDREFIIHERQGVRGDRQATIFTLSDGRELIILDRCGNLVFPESFRE